MESQLDPELNAERAELRMTENSEGFQDTHTYVITPLSYCKSPLVLPLPPNLLKSEIQLCKFEDLIDFIKQFIN